MGQHGSTARPEKRGQSRHKEDERCAQPPHAITAQECRIKGIAAPVGLPVLAQIVGNGRHNQVRIGVGGNLSQCDGNNREQQDHHRQPARKEGAQLPPAIRPEERANAPPTIPGDQNKERIVVREQRRRGQEDKAEPGAPALA